MSTSNRLTKGDIIVQVLVAIIGTMLVNFMVVVYFNLDQHVPFWMLCIMTLIWALMAIHIVMLGRRWGDLSAKLPSSERSSSFTPPYSDEDEERSGYDGWMSPDDRPTFNPPPTDNENDQNEDEDDWEVAS